MATESFKIKKRKKKNLGSYPYTTVVFSITMALFVIGLFSLLLIHAEKLSGIIKEKFELHVYLQNNITDNKRISLMKMISDQPYILKKENTPQIHFISKEEAAKRFIEETGENFSRILEDNPLHPSFTLKINAEYSDTLELKTIKAQLLQMDGVFEVEYKENLITLINNNIRKIGIILLSFSVILILTSVLLINNTIKLALYSQRFLIRSMQLVGAKTNFIRWPFLKYSLLHGLLSGILSIILLTGVLYMAYREIPDLRIFRDDLAFIILFSALIVAGIVIGFLSTLRAVSKYLKMSLDELY
ncbi:MAG: cell division protein FtsX [Cytophagaceae bacterium]